jgi:2',3'-cyclic-nucleotide 2'-phosphodiesterase / 3'-nucleotidase / 5'-nucleotidase
VSVYTDHFSTYGVFEGQPQSSNIPTQANELPDTATNNFNILVVGFILLIVGIGLYFGKRRNSRTN